ncbi:hypothetical protein BHE74_00048484 [Ensete ventricosum]|nr:hypothetical protein BHE74_00048484 [Ensete ventricosum]
MTNYMPQWWRKRNGNSGVPANVHGAEGCVVGGTDTDEGRRWVFGNSVKAVVMPNGLPKIHTHGGGAGKKEPENGICHDDSAPPVKAQTIDELHSLQKKRSAPTTPIKDGLQQQQGNAAFATISEEERHKLQLQSIRYLPSINLCF